MISLSIKTLPIPKRLCIFDNVLKSTILSEISMSWGPLSACLGTGQDDPSDVNTKNTGESNKSNHYSGSGVSSRVRMNGELEIRFKDAKRKFQYFWKSKDVFSQWHPSNFTEDGIYFTCAEQYMFYHKAIIFGDDGLAQRVLQTSDPRKMKALGRQVRQFKYSWWCDHCLNVVKTGNIHKYTQNKKLKEALFSTYPKVLVEASPLDRIWGIGLDERDERAWDESTWEGQNLLGYILTEVRDELMYKEEIIKFENRRIYKPELQDKLQKLNLKEDPWTAMDGEYD